MKIICVDYNYPEYNKEQNISFLPKRPVVFTKPDSAILKDGKPFFLPDFSEDIRCRAGLVIRVCRLGKNIAKRFAYRYYDAVTVGIDIYANDLREDARQNCLPYALYDGFDGSAVLGDFVMTDELGQNVSGISFSASLDGNEVQKGNLRDMLFGIDEIIEYVSSFYTLKIGDLIFTGFPSSGFNVAIDNELQGFVGDRKVLDFFIR